MQRLNGLCRLVAHDVTPADVHGAPLRIDVHVGVDGHDLRLWQLLVLPEGLLVVCLPVQQHVGRRVVVQDVGVVVDEAARDHEPRQRNQQIGQHTRAQSQSRETQAHAQGCLAAAHPEQVAQSHEDERGKAPVDGEPQERRHEVAVAVHVGVRVARCVGVAVQVVLEVQRREDGQADEVQHHEQEAHVFVAGHHLDEEGEDGELQERDAVHQEHALEVQWQLEVGIAMPGLEADARRNADAEHQHDDAQQGDQPGAP